jgi:carbon-monoxide dehydrogenase medium subunit
MRLSQPSILIDLNGVSGLDGIALKEGFVEIGALVRQAAAAKSDVIAKHAPLFAMALPHIAHPAIRNRGTIGGSIAFADPAAELPACFLTLGGEAEIAGPKGRRSVKADDFFKALYETAIGAGDMLTAIRIPAARPDMRYGFAELSRRHGDYALAGLAASARADGAALMDVRLAYFGVDLTPVRAKGAEIALAKGNIDEAVKALASDLDPPNDIQESGTVKRHLAGVLLRRVAAQLTGART